ncbi:MAG: hypothetical protein ABF255_15800 [Planktotalea arctica]
MALTMDQMGQNPAFERFLRAKVGEDANGTDVSVISMLARLEVDPWAEASDLAAMPDAPARKRLGFLLSRFKDVPTLSHEQGKIVSKLLDLLPRKMKITSSPELERKLPVFMISVPLYWYIIAFLLLRWVYQLAQGQ